MILTFFIFPSTSISAPSSDFRNISISRFFSKLLIQPSEIVLLSSSISISSFSTTSCGVSHLKFSEISEISWCICFFDLQSYISCSSSLDVFSLSTTIKITSIDVSSKAFLIKFNSAKLFPISSLNFCSVFL